MFVCLFLLQIIKYNQLAVSNLIDLEKKLTKIHIRRGILSKCAIRALVDLLRYFALETNEADDRTTADFVIFPISRVYKGSYV